jgi:hypothetical protein
MVSAPRPAVRIERDSSGPIEVVWLDNAKLRLGLVPALGGRLLSVRFAATELFWRNDSLLDDRLLPVSGHVPTPTAGPMGDWVNYGGDKTWVAPQGWDGPAQWAGPPDPVLDSGQYTVDVEAGSVTLTSGADPRTGLRLTRTVTLLPGSASYRLTLTATNVSTRPVRWALWNVTQLPGGGAVEAGIEADHEAPVVGLVEGTGVPAYRFTAPDRVVVPSQDIVGKLGFPGSAGWVAYAGNEATMTQSFAVQAGAEYPDRGSPLEVWLEHPLPQPLAELGGLDPPARIVECEVLGPVTDLAPGARMALTIDTRITPTVPR